ncbi:MAG: HAMP domain-containing sensor histidine kinase [Pelobium sp.]
MLINKDKVINIWAILCGDKEHFSFEERIYHSLSYLIFIFCAILTIVNLSIGFTTVAIIIVPIILIHSFIVYLSRVKGKFKLAIFLTSIECNLYIGIVYFLKGGIHSPLLVCLITTLFLLASIVEIKKIIIYLFFNLITIVLISSVELYYPQSILSTYKNRTDMYTDNVISYILVSSLIACGIYFLRKNNHQQKAALENSAISLIKMNDEKDKLFSIISHDLKTPLNAVKQYLEFLNEGNLTPEERKFIEEQLLITTIGTQNLLHNLLDWSRNQIEGRPLALEYLNLEECLVDTVKNAKGLCEKKEITFINDIDRDINCFLNKHMIEMIVRNLLNNAIKFTHPNGYIKLATEVKDKICRISIKDDGMGIAQADQADLFSLKIKSSSGTQNERGTGLGLVLCKEYIQKLGGEIGFESEVGKGSTFYITLLCE